LGGSLGQFLGEEWKEKLLRSELRNEAGLTVEGIYLEDVFEATQTQSIVSWLRCVSTQSICHPTAVRKKERGDMMAYCIGTL
jgi:hypothetical protein